MGSSIIGMNDNQIKSALQGGKLPVNLLLVLHDKRVQLTLHVSRVQRIGRVFHMRVPATNDINIKMSVKLDSLMLNSELRNDKCGCQMIDGLIIDSEMLHTCQAWHSLDIERPENPAVSSENNFHRASLASAPTTICSPLGGSYQTHIRGCAS